MTAFPQYDAERLGRMNLDMLSSLLAKAEWALQLRGVPIEIKLEGDEGEKPKAPVPEMPTPPDPDSLIDKYMGGN